MGLAFFHCILIFLQSSQKDKLRFRIIFFVFYIQRNEWFHICKARSRFPGDFHAAHKPNPCGASIETHISDKLPTFFVATSSCWRVPLKKNVFIEPLVPCSPGLVLILVKLETTCWYWTKCKNSQSISKKGDSITLLNRSTICSFSIRSSKMNFKFVFFEVKCTTEITVNVFTTGGKEQTMSSSSRWGNSVVISFFVFEYSLVRFIHLL